MVILIINSMLSTPNAKFVTAGLTDFYLETPMEHPKYIRIPVKFIKKTM
eukprot:CAMPEP_0202451368 /NCGR_PEP_ID=MMETSP1360-20130828/9828_1 /ASSEMBLY_ACC=CAM_ASM_000848 /TAXON_ID=515479 /ORGANISM="Licmophora paradoxa, Strain CCMP2313" /LENGTH=48 /DNA_ID= /DNA_START= /DNA_END= /DNA_ORIENTATION=